MSSGRSKGREYSTLKLGVRQQDQIMERVKIDCSQIRNWDSFHDTFKSVFGFPEFYGRNMDAWIDCMTCLDDPGAGMSARTCKAGDFVLLELDHAGDLKTKCPDIFSALLECSGFVNYRRIETGEPPVLILSLYS